MLRVCREKLVGAVPQFPPQMEQSIIDYEVAMKKLMSLLVLRIGLGRSGIRIQ
jgi:hypothetical protein